MKLITHEQIMSLNISQKQGYEWIKESFLNKKKIVNYHQNKHGRRWTCILQCNAFPKS